MNEWQQRLLSNAADRLYAAIPRRRPEAARLADARLVAHRGLTGEDDAPAENTIDAFDRCLALGLFGVELDLQWTADGVPVVFHDRDTSRRFGAPGVRIDETRFDEVRSRHPDIPSLDEAVARFGKRLHLMIEIKADTWSPRRLPELKRCLEPLVPVADYHLLCLSPSLLADVDGLEPDPRMAVAETNTREIVAAVHRLRLPAMAGHYVLLDTRRRRDLRARGVRFGTGMVPSANVLRRELSLGSEWIFTNHAARLAGALRGMRRAAGVKLCSNSKP